MLGPGLAEAGRVGGDGEVAGHADLLAAGDAHPVDPIDDRLVAAQDDIDHVVEQAHVLLVLLRVARVVLGVLLGIPARAERLVAHRREHDTDDAAVHAGLAKGEDDLLDRIGGVAVELLRVVERDPRVVQALDRLTRRIDCGAELVEDLLELALWNKSMTLQHDAFLPYYAQSGTSIARLSIS